MRSRSSPSYKNLSVLFHDRERTFLPGRQGVYSINGRERVLALPGLLTNALIEKFVCIDEVPSATCAPRAWTRDVRSARVDARRALRARGRATSWPGLSRPSTCLLGVRRIWLSEMPGTSPGMTAGVTGQSTNAGSAVRFSLSPPLGAERAGVRWGCLFLTRPPRLPPRPWLRAPAGSAAPGG